MVPLSGFICSNVRIAHLNGSAAGFGSIPSGYGSWKRTFHDQFDFWKR